MRFTNSDAENVGFASNTCKDVGMAAKNLIEKHGSKSISVTIQQVLNTWPLFSTVIVSADFTDYRFLISILSNFIIFTLLPI